MFIETIKVDGLANNSYVVGSEQSGRCASKMGTSSTWGSSS